MNSIIGWPGNLTQQLVPLGNLFSPTLFFTVPLFMSCAIYVMFVWIVIYVVGNLLFDFLIAKNIN